jgi:hypothetical protein
MAITEATTEADLLAAARTLTSAEQGDEFVRECVKSELGRAFLARPEWLVIQRGLADRAATAQAAEAAVDAGAEWDRLVDEMVKLPTVKMAHEFLCRTQVSDVGRAFLDGPIWLRWARARFPELDPVSGQIGAPPRRPQVGDDVVYVSYGTPGGEFGREERTARVTGAGAWLDVEIAGANLPHPGNLRRVVQVWSPMACALTVMNPTGFFQPPRVEFDDGRLVTDQAEKDVLAGDLIGGRVYQGGTWHWPRPRTTEYTIEVSAADAAALRLMSERMAAGQCPDHGKDCKTWVRTLSGGTHVGGPVE